MQAIRQYAEVENGSLHLRLPDDFTGKKVEVIILPIEKEHQQAEEAGISRSEKLYAHRVRKS